MWLLPQRSEHDHDYNIDRKYFESIMRLSLESLTAQGLISLSVDANAEEGDGFAYCLTDKGRKFVEEIVLISE